MNYSSLSCDELVRACAESGNSEAWQEFVSRFERLISLVVWRVARRYGENDSSVIEDLVQDTYTKVCEDDCRVLRGFRSQHPDAFFGFIKVTAANVAHDYFRKSNAVKRGSGKVDADLEDAEGFTPNPHSAGPDLIERRILLREIDAVLSSISGERDREIFWLHYGQGLAASSIAEIPLYRLTVKGVESVLCRLRCEVRSRLAERPGIVVQPPPGNEGISPPKALSKGEGQS